MIIGSGLAVVVVVVVAAVAAAAVAAAVAAVVAGSSTAVAAAAAAAADWIHILYGSYCCYDYNILHSCHPLRCYVDCPDLILHKVKLVVGLALQHWCCILHIAVNELVAVFDQLPSLQRKRPYKVKVHCSD